jgi:alpha-beta hydrolase superfamily lysophospholipase
MQLDAGQISRSADVVAAYQADPLVHNGKISARLVTELFATLTLVNENAAKITLPIKIFHGESDVMTSPKLSQAFVGKVGSAMAEYQGYAGLYHEIFNEPERAKVMQDVQTFIEQAAAA